MTLEQIANESLLLHLRGMGLAADNSDGSILLGVGALSTHCQVLEHRNYGDAHAVMLGVNISPCGDHGAVIHESLIELGETPEHAVLEAVHKLVEGVFAPIRELYEPGTGDPQMRRFKLLSQDVDTGQRTRWEVIAGPQQIAGDHPLELFDQLAAHPPFLVIQNPLTAYLADARLHWLRLFLCRRMDGSVIGECKLDGVSWPEALGVLSTFQWPAVPGYLAFRQFIILKPVKEGAG